MGEVRKIEVTRTCRNCGKQFTSTSGAARYCRAEECQAARWAAKRAVQKAYFARMSYADRVRLRRERAEKQIVSAWDLIKEAMQDD